jgi:hypothetical protein
MDKEMWFLYTMEYNSAIKKDEIISFAGKKWMELESFMLSEICQTQKHKYCMLSLVWNLGLEKRT